MDLMREIKKFFFRAMSQGWVAGAEEIEIPELPGYKAIIFEESELRLVDAYCVNGKKSFGFTTIFVNDQPVWTMSYEGWYEKRALPFLVQALRSTYERSLFHGCRGPITLEWGILRYRNSWTGDFSAFSGNEDIHEMPIVNSPILLGRHEYRGMSLI